MTVATTVLAATILASRLQADPTPTATPSGDAAEQSVTQAFDALVNIGTGIALSVVAFMILWGGFKYMTARGNPIAMERAKSTLEHAGIGFGIVILCNVLANLLQSAIHV